MKNIIKKYKWLLIICVLFIAGSCSSGKKYIEGNTQVRVEYFGEAEANICRPDFKCVGPNDTECVKALYDEMTRATAMGVQILKKGGDIGSAALQFSFAQCNAQSINNILNLMKAENYDEWMTLRQKGFMKHMKKTNNGLNSLIEKCKYLEYSEE
tara:strand:- start:3967 stop:4431 length:465 start_codon:yes stop_codon:yes gene_type:complete